MFTCIYVHMYICIFVYVYTVKVSFCIDADVWMCRYKRTHMHVDMYTMHVLSLCAHVLLVAFSLLDRWLSFATHLSIAKALRAIWRQALVAPGARKAAAL